MIGSNRPCGRRREAGVMWQLAVGGERCRVAARPIRRRLVERMRWPTADLEGEGGGPALEVGGGTENKERGGCGWEVGKRLGCPKRKEEGLK